ncbi:hypothetical protein MTP99_007720 [Tenebrio molitor]|nr:hypothetical protein MTP99_007720 [Tenebrio molitor]
MQYMIWRGTLRPAARHAAKDAEKLMAIPSEITVASSRSISSHSQGARTTWHWHWERARCTLRGRCSDRSLGSIHLGRRGHEQH